MDDMAGYYPPPPSQPPPISHHHHNPMNHSSSSSHYPYYPLPPAPPQSHFPHWQHHHHQPQPFSSPSYLPGPSSGYIPPPTYLDYNSEDDVRTLFIAGFPQDVKPREIYNLFREFPGYQSSKLRDATKTSQAFGFATFADRNTALAALQALNGMVFDLEQPSTLYIDLAKSNSRSKRSRTDDGRSGFADKKVRGSSSISASRGPLDSAGHGGNIHMPGMSKTAYNITGYSTTQRHGFDDGAGNDANSENLNSGGFHGPKNGTPCPTLFVANLGPTCSEQELNHVFSRCSGFLKLKMQNKNGAPVAFVDFQDIACSTSALNKLQDTVLYSFVGEGMRLEYAKSRMGLRRKT
ncbi:uncharacterized protein LOC113289127 isoform X2 [Papaver somniferum]|uniref:uncharacterized protein LOC113289127 isoform X1 n=1 Tax=Papaver somniferum TaxID=3469 RepID=UPI000E6F860E|nr:uncharacterized protein LOC113289127 isoform X1 [Papaver somniferum]XP_026394092.1 uncharacterized protein LOC113289127 isoform X2 [Papaver somniferum]